MLQLAVWTALAEKGLGASLQLTQHRLSDLPGLLHQSPLLRLLPVTCLTALPSRQRRLDPLRVTFPKGSTLNRSKKR